MTQETFTRNEVEAACCVWEWMTDATEGAALPHIIAMDKEHGAAAMRDIAINAGRVVSATYEAMMTAGYGYMLAFDWDFVPDVCRRLDFERLETMNPDALFAAVLADDEGKDNPDFYEVQP